MNGKMIIMKRYYLYLLSIIVLISCSKEQDAIINNGVNYSPKFYVEIDNTLTRTYVNDALKVCWNENDKLSVFTSTENQQYQFEGNTGDPKGTFSKVESYSSSTGSLLSVDANYAFYPYHEENTISSDGTLSFDLPQNQVYTQNSFGINSNPMIAVTENKNDTYLSFKNICGYLRLSLYGDNITAKSIRLEGNSNERISGKAHVSISYGQEPVITLANDASYTITLDCCDGVQIGESASDATEFWFVVPPVTFENGFTIIIEDINGNKYIKSTEKEIKIKRNAISNMAISKVDLPDVTGTWTCKEKHSENYETYTVTLHKDGTVTTSKSELEDNYKYKSWSQSAKGLSVRFTTSDGNMGHDLYITFDDPTNPTSGKGETHRWIVSAFGISHDTWYNLEMTR